MLLGPNKIPLIFNNSTISDKINVIKLLFLEKLLPKKVYFVSVALP